MLRLGDLGRPGKCEGGVGIGKDVGVIQFDILRRFTVPCVLGDELPDNANIA